MLTLSPAAATVLDETRSQQGIPSDATLRVASTAADDGQQPGFTIGFVDQPMDGDQTGEAHGMPFCVSPDAADVLSNASIDVRTDDGQPQLVIVPAG